ncbi:hypothetical protein SDC9_122586 [bioreactor metagenome]|uniref:Regulator of ribonuclease activity B domain-containing protein n=1 Tax=bioreactor metagenome TaxID=1076179 RepID=A0A645CFF6_9ZZZZ
MRDWYVYDWDLQGLPAQFHVDLRYVEEFDTLGDFTTLLYVSCYPKKAEAQAFSAREKRVLDNVSKECERILGEHCAFVGFIDILAQRRYYFYTSDARLLVPLMAYCAEEDSLRLECFKAEEPNRQTYYRLLIPDNAKRQSVDNAAYIASLRQRGDDNAAYRRVNLHFYFPSASGRTLFGENAKTLGFAIGKTDYIPEREPSYYIVLHAISPLDQESITELTTKAIYAAETYGGVMEHFDSAFIQKRGIFG